MFVPVYFRVDWLTLRRLPARRGCVPHGNVPLRGAVEDWSLGLLCHTHRNKPLPCACLVPGQERAYRVTSECGRYVYQIESIGAYDESTATFLVRLQNHPEEPAAWYPARQVGSAAIAAFKRDAAAAARIATANRKNTAQWARDAALKGLAGAWLASGDSGVNEEELNGDIVGESEKQEPEHGGSDVDTESGPAVPSVRVDEGARGNAEGR
jgi:hypothetical protein